MKIKQTIVSIVAIAFLCQAFSVSAAFFVASEVQNSVSLKALPVPQVTTVVKVVSLPTQPQVVATRQLESSVSPCIASNLGQDIALQNTLNSSLLKLPANCFNLLSGSSLPQSVVKINTNPLPQVVYTIVVLPYSVVYLHEISKARAVPIGEAPLLPLAVISFVAVIVFGKKYNIEKIGKSLSILRSSLTIDQLQVFRC